MPLLQVLGLSLLTCSVFVAAAAILTRRGVGTVLAVVDSVSYENADGKKCHVVGKLPKLGFTFRQGQGGSIPQQKAALVKMFVSEISKVLPEHVRTSGQVSFAIRYWHSFHKTIPPCSYKLLENHEAEGIVQVCFSENSVPKPTAAFGPPRRNKSYQVAFPAVPTLGVMKIILAEVNEQGKSINTGEPVADQYPARVPTGEKFSCTPLNRLTDALVDVYDIRRRSDLDGGRTLDFSTNAKWSLADICWKRVLWFYCVLLLPNAFGGFLLFVR